MKTTEEIEAKNVLFDETEQLLQFGTWSYDVKTMDTVWTSGVTDLLGYSQEEMPGKMNREFFMSHVLPEFRSEINKLLDGVDKKNFEVEYNIQTKSGLIKTVSSKGKVVFDEGGEVLKLLGITRDITAFKNFEKEQEKNLRELNRSNKELEEFAYVASHDLQEPLRKIAMFSERLSAKHRDALDKEGQLFMDRILASTENMRRLIDNLLEFSRANRSSQAFELTDLKNVIDQVINNLELKIEETKTKIVISTLPRVEVVSSEMEQIFTNLLTNAIKFRHESEIPEISITARQATNQEKSEHNLPKSKVFHVFEIKDNGIGFEEEYAEKIFLVFQRLHGKTEYPGSGIGLAICKRIVENHKGVIFAKSTPGSGSTFTVILPEKQF